MFRNFCHAELAILVGIEALEHFCSLRRCINCYSVLLRPGQGFNDACQLSGVEESIPVDISIEESLRPIFGRLGQ